MLSSGSFTGGGIGTEGGVEVLGGLYGCFLVAALIGCSFTEQAKPNITGWKKVKTKVSNCDPRDLLTGFTRGLPAWTALVADIRTDSSLHSAGYKVQMIL